MNEIRTLILAVLMTFGCRITLAEWPTGDPGMPMPTAVITLSDHTTLEARLLGAEEGVLRVVVSGHHRKIPLENIDRIDFQRLKMTAPQDDSIRIPEYVKQLKDDYEQLFINEPVRIQKALREADRLLRVDAQQPATWTAYLKAIDLIHRNPSKAAIPMLLKLLADDRLCHHNYEGQIYRTMVILTGRPIPGATTEEVARQWWFPQKDEITVDLADAGDAELRVIAGKLLEIVARKEPCGARRYPPLSSGHVSSMLAGGYRLYAGEYEYMMSDRMLSELLDATSDPRQRWLTIGPLAAMHHRGRIDLEQVACDGNAPIARRVVAAAALHRLGKRVPVEQLSEMFRTASDLDLKKVVVSLLGRSRDPGAVETVIGCLGHGDDVMCDIAAHAAGYQQTPAAAEPLARVIRRRLKENKRCSAPIYALGNIKTQKSAKLLADLIEDVAQSDPESYTLHYLVSAFGKATGQSFSGKTYLDEANAALRWWRDEL